MLYKQKTRVKKRFYVIFSVIIFILCMALGKIFQGSPVYTVDMPVMNQGNETTEANTSSRPASSDKWPVICIDPGHGGHDAGAESILGFNEKDVNLKIGLQAGKLLEKDGYEVIYTRTTDEAKGDNQKEDLKARCNFANENNADIYVAVHCNIDKTSKKSKGLEIWCRFPNEKGEELAICLNNRLAEMGYTRDRGIKYESQGELFVLKNTEAVAVVAELGFLSNPEDSAYLISDEGQAKCAEAMAKAIKDYVSKASEYK